ncbi:MAG TPA: thiolase family protein, partial [Chthonomonadales bacterium]|nr:thiolase family protein [Chthonomonadales bacterium]
AALVLAEALRRAPGVDASEVGDVVVGCAMPEREQGMNVARIAALRAGLPASTPAVTVNRFCASGLEAIAVAAHRIWAGSAEVTLAGGVESMSLVPFDRSPMRPNPTLMRQCPDVYLGMGLTGENLAAGWSISREEADNFSLESHRKALDAIDSGRFREEIVAIQVERREVGANGELIAGSSQFETDECPRRETSLEALAALKPVFCKDGAITAGNSSQRSDGAAALMLMSLHKAEELGIEPLARFKAYSTAGVPPEVMGIGPAYALPGLLRSAGIGMDAVKVVELNEAFAAQALAVMRAFPLAPADVNPNGGAVALGHPLGCTGARQAVTLVHELRRRGGGNGIVTMCVGGGMGAAGLFTV